MNNIISKTWLAIVAGMLTAHVPAAVLSNTTANGVVYLTYDRAAWATIAPSAEYTDIHSNPLGITNTCADVDGRRWMFPDRLEGTNWVAAAYPSDYLTPLPDYQLVQPAGGFVLPVNSYVSNSFAANHKITSYNSTSNTNGYIGLGGSLRSTSDFNEPGASVWWEHLALMQDPADSIWKLYATSGPGQGSVFELRNVTTETINGNLHLSGDYVFGNTDWLQFFQDVNGHLDTNTILGHIELVPVGVSRVVAGKAVINYDRAAWDGLAAGFSPPLVGLTNTAFFNQAQANALSQSNLLHDVQVVHSYSNQVYALNGPTVANLPSRFTQPTTFFFPNGELTNHVGKIGLGGVARFAVFGGLGGNLLYGDFTLQYDSARIGLGGSGWYLLGNIPPAAAAFDLLNVSVVETTNYFTISGDLGVSFEVANFLYYTPSDTLADVGDFSFTGYTVPLTSSTITEAILAGNSLTLIVTNGLPGSTYTVLASTNLTSPVTTWTSIGAGAFNASGVSTNSLTVYAGEPAQYLRLQQP